MSLNIIDTFNQIQTKTVQKGVSKMDIKDMSGTDILTHYAQKLNRAYRRYKLMYLNRVNYG